jgi:hypothetical protein
MLLALARSRPRCKAERNKRPHSLFPHSFFRRVFWGQFALAACCLLALYLYFLFLCLRSRRPYSFICYLLFYFYSNIVYDTYYY